ncbi:hypothetical protein [Nannocystis pusilla]|uniref:hypothetical protein n=1 Tax=Nannocystis pusilla TaxID=889268 RepID=UPI003B7705E0
MRAQTPGGETEGGSSEGSTSTATTDDVEPTTSASTTSASTTGEATGESETAGPEAMCPAPQTSDVMFEVVGFADDFQGHVQAACTVKGRRSATCRTRSRWLAMSTAATSRSR